MVTMNVVNAVIVTLLGYFTLSRSSISIERGFIHPVIGGIAMGVGTVTYFMLIEQYEVSLILRLTILYLVVTLGLSIVFLHEQMTLVRIVGVVLMMIATFLLSL
jgi:transporter family protein